MRPEKSLPYSDEFSSADEYVEALLHYVTTTPIFQTLCGGVHIMDFYTTDPGLFYSVVPADWQPFLLDQEPMELLGFLLQDDMDAVMTAGADDKDSKRVPPPDSLVKYVRDVRRLCLQRSFELDKPPPLARKITMGMNVKKVHEVTHFAEFVSRLSDDVSTTHPDQPITHLVDVGSGQNYLGRALACAPYHRRVVAVESKIHNIAGAKGLDMLTGVAVPAQRPMRNKKLYQQLLNNQLPPEKQNEKVRNRLVRTQTPDVTAQPEIVAATELRSRRELAQSAIYSESAAAAAAPEEVATPADSPILYVQGRLENGDLSDVLAQVPVLPTSQSGEGAAVMQKPGFLAVSIHSCGNLSHYGLRALVLNPAVRAVAIVGCCYNLMTEKLGPPTYKLPGLRRPTLQPVNGRVVREADRRDPEGFPMSAHMSTYELPGDGSDNNTGERGIRFNITARMMACQAPQNWTASESENFFARHFYRAVLQRIFLDRGVVERVRLDGGENETENDALNTAISPIIVGSLRKACYASLPAYVRGAVAKIAAQGNGDGKATDAQNAAVNAAVADKMASLTDADLDAYASRYGPRIRELSAVWSLMAFSAGVVESAIVTDRWLYLREQQAQGVADCWVESVFAYGQSPRNLVVVGIKR
ncbi:hypothetical protein CMQ_656 [Grosmannia clavigera kw1407]|uniref:Methyltransferase domain-containing protein n=1 Tax=Grosmannia clavigera (strain kw1407 / UAMH 11150) TaxID=655863 RepID=F0XEP0_GROCL|nr:uncharacterized protein CMQ_656 [Grosmannia clavigera kw1407]EFX03728.1 hypothetical protein CMQ_656 [Grosmannia clavigera kw1407]